MGVFQIRHTTPCARTLISEAAAMHQRHTDSSLTASQASFHRRKMDIMAIGEELRLRLHDSGQALIRDRRFRLKLYANCFVSREVVNWLVENKEAESREQAVEVMRTLQDYNILHHVCDEHEFKDEYLFFRFRQDDGTYPQEPDALAFARGQRIYSRVKLEKNMIKDRKYHLKSYKRCFVGKELVDWLVANNEATDREEGLRIGRELLEAGCIHHVCDDHHFKDGHLFYRFRNDEEEKKKFSDLLGAFKHLSPSMHRNPKTKTMSISTSATPTISSQKKSESDKPPATGDLPEYVNVEPGYTPMNASSQRTPMPVPSPSEEQVVLPVTLEELMAPNSPFIKKTVKIASDPVGYGFVIRGGRPVHVHTVDPAGPAAAAGLTVGEYLVSVNGQEVLESTHTEAARLILIGPSAVTLVTLQRMS